MGPLAAPPKLARAICAAVALLSAGTLAWAEEANPAELTADRARSEFEAGVAAGRWPSEPTPKAAIIAAPGTVQVLALSPLRPEASPQNWINPGPAQIEVGPRAQLATSSRYAFGQWSAEFQIDWKAAQRDLNLNPSDPVLVIQAVIPLQGIQGKRPWSETLGKTAVVEAGSLPDQVDIAYAISPLHRVLLTAAAFSCALWAIPAGWITFRRRRLKGEAAARQWSSTSFMVGVGASIAFIMLAGASGALTLAARLWMGSDIGLAWLMAPCLASLLAFMASQSAALWLGAKRAEPDAEPAPQFIPQSVEEFEALLAFSSRSTRFPWRKAVIDGGILLILLLSTWPIMSTPFGPLSWAAICIGYLYLSHVRTKRRREKFEQELTQFEAELIAARKTAPH